MKERLIVSHNRRLYLLLPDDICCIQGDGSYTIISLCNGEKMRISQNLKCLSAEMPHSFTQFLRVHKSWLVNMNHIEYINPKGNKSWHLHLSNNTDVPLSGSPNTILEMLNVKSSSIRLPRPQKENIVTRHESKKNNDIQRAESYSNNLKQQQKKSTKNIAQEDDYIIIKR